MTNLNEITYVDWQCKLNDIGSIAEGVNDINQCIAIILETQKGSNPYQLLSEIKNKEKEHSKY